MNTLPIASAAAMAPGLSLAETKPERPSPRTGRRIAGTLSGREIPIPDLDRPPMPQIADSGMVHDDRTISSLPELDLTIGHPDVLSHRMKFGLLIPATNTTMESELWHILVKAASLAGMDGIGLHTSNVITPRPVLNTAADLENYKQQFLTGLREALSQAMLAQPHYLILGMSLEHILDDLDELKAPVLELEKQSGLACATWHEAAVAALQRFQARRIGLLTPFDANGNRNARKIFEALGFEVVSTFGFACANALHIAHVPDEAKKAAITRHLATAENRLDAVIQCGTNMSLTRVSEALEPNLGMPVIGINAALLWYALRENGFSAPLSGAGRLFREF
jgi:maleate isomerase